MIPGMDRGMVTKLSEKSGRFLTGLRNLPVLPAPLAGSRPRLSQASSRFVDRFERWTRCPIGQPGPAEPNQRWVARHIRGLPIVPSQEGERRCIGSENAFR